MEEDLQDYEQDQDQGYDEEDPYGEEPPAPRTTNPPAAQSIPIQAAQDNTKNILDNLYGMLILISQFFFNNFFSVYSRIFDS